MRLYGKRIEDLHCFGKVYRVDQIVDGIVPIIMTEHDQRLVNAGRLGQTDNQLAQILQAIVALNGHYHSGIGNRTKDIFVSDALLLVDKFDLVQNSGDFEVGDDNGFGREYLSLVGQAVDAFSTEAAFGLRFGF